MATFLPKGKRIHLKLRKATLNRGGSTRQHNFQLELDLTEGDETLTGLPEWIQNAFTNVARLSNVTGLQKFEVEFSGETLEFFGGAKTKQRLWPVVLNAHLSKFAMTRTGSSDEDVEVKMTFTALFDTTKQINEWVFDEDDTEFWMSSESPQRDLDMTADNTASKDDDEEEDEQEAQKRRAAEAGARTTPLIPLIPRRTPASPHN